MKNKTRTRLMIGGTVLLFLAAVIVMGMIGSTIDVDHCLFSIGFGQAVAC
tara:strand:- start:233 stop:382 length:150 start_codon:yes stop_codon:yes gene_type:complete